MTKSIALQNCKSLEEVVSLINAGGTSDFSAEDIALQYALEAAHDQGDTSQGNVDAHLNILRDNGADI